MVSGKKTVFSWRSHGVFRPLEMVSGKKNGPSVFHGVFKTLRDGFWQKHVVS
jgi:hypothetical protein